MRFLVHLLRSCKLAGVLVDLWFSLPESDGSRDLYEVISAYLLLKLLAIGRNNCEFLTAVKHLAYEKNKKL